MAVELYNSGNYAEACKQFVKVKNYRDSESNYMESAYQIAVEARNNKDYVSADPIFEALGNYKDSAELVYHPDYNEHRYMVKDKKPATSEEDGWILYHCQKCGDEYKSVIKATGGD